MELLFLNPLERSPLPPKRCAVWLPWPSLWCPFQNGPASFVLSSWAYSGFSQTGPLKVPALPCVCRCTVCSLFCAGKNQACLSSFSAATSEQPSGTLPWQQVCLCVPSAGLHSPSRGAGCALCPESPISCPFLITGSPGGRLPCSLLALAHQCSGNTWAFSLFLSCFLGG